MYICNTSAVRRARKDHHILCISQVRQAIARPLKKVTIGRLTNPLHPSVAHGGEAGAHALFAAETIKKGELIGFYSGALVMSDEMDSDADNRLDGRYAVDFPLPGKPSEACRAGSSTRDCLVIDASMHRNEFAFMNDFRDNPFAPQPANGYRSDRTTLHVTSARPLQIM